MQIMSALEIVDINNIHYIAEYEHIRNVENSIQIILAPGCMAPCATNIRIMQVTEV